MPGDGQMGRNEPVEDQVNVGDAILACVRDGATDAESGGPALKMM